jgi:hypothetical protein
VLVQDTFAAFDLAEDGRAEAWKVDEVGEVFAAFEAGHASGCAHTRTDAFLCLVVHEPGRYDHWLKAVYGRRVTFLNVA